MTGVPSTVELLERSWGLHGARVVPLGGGINSETWLVEHGGSTYVAKRVSPEVAPDLLRGCEAAEALVAYGIVTGRPVPTTDGALLLADHGLALLQHVPGRELTGDTDREQERMATTLASVHLAGTPSAGPSSSSFMADWLAPDLPGVADHPWLVRVVEAVRAETSPLAVTWSLLHTDPAPEAFVHDGRTGVTGLVDWTGARRGPVLYDVASAVMYLGGAGSAAAFLDAYRIHGPLGTEELRHLDAFRRMREAVQGTYFARRLAAHDLTGGVDQADNERGLDDARRRLRSLGLDSVGPADAH